MNSSGNNPVYASHNAGIFSDVSTIAYVRPVTTEKGKAYAVCASDGTQLAVFGTRDAAYCAARQHDLEPVHLH